MSEAPSLKCPQCGNSAKLCKDGIRYLQNGEACQRYLCKLCGLRFSFSENSKNESRHKRDCRVGALGFESRAKNSAAKAVVLADNIMGETESGLAGATETAKSQDVKGKIVEFLWYMKKNGYSTETITTYITVIKKLMENGADLTKPEHVKEVLSKFQISNAYRHNIIAAYTLYLKMQGLTWNPPMCNVTHALPFIPTERELDDLIAAVGKKTGAFLQLLKETAMRRGEASRLKWINVDLERKTITLNNPEKNGKARIFNISDKLVNMLAALPKTSEYVFGTDNKMARSSVFYRLRKRIAHKLANPRILEIGLHTFRHWKATMLYHQTKDIVLVKEFLGHKSLDNTLLYVQLEQALFREEGNEFHVKATSDPEEIKALLEVGFEYVCSKDGLMFFRKRK